MIQRSTFMVFKNDNLEHEYWGLDGKLYESMSGVKKHVVPPFDPGVAYFMAKGEYKKEGVEPTEEQIQQRADMIRAGWEKKRDDAADHGTDIHKMMEDNAEGKTAEMSKDQKRIVDDVEKYLTDQNPFKHFNEFIVHSKKYQTAGQIDRLQVRQRTKEGCLDIFDYKSNLEGFTFDSSKRNPDGTIKKHYHRFMLPPLDHLEHSKFMEAAIQLSGYALMIEEMYGMRPGKLEILLIYPDLSDWRPYPVPYMKNEVIKLFDHHKNSKPIGGDDFIDDDF